MIGVKSVAIAWQFAPALTAINTLPCGGAMMFIPSNSEDAMNAPRLLLAAVMGTFLQSASAFEIFTPPLPASPEQNLSCGILNVSSTPQIVSSRALDGKSRVIAATLTQTLAPGEAGGLSTSGSGGAMYCRFDVDAHPDLFRTSIKVFEMTLSGNFRIVAALPGR
ncbi:MAG: hypothetical protein ACM3X5_05025 [Bacillota bacterium]